MGDSLVLEFRRRSITFGKRVARHGPRIVEMFKDLPPPDESPNVKARLDMPGGFFPKDLIPRRLGGE